MYAIRDSSLSLADAVSMAPGSRRTDGHSEVERRRPSAVKWRGSSESQLKSGRAYSSSVPCGLDLLSGNSPACPADQSDVSFSRLTTARSRRRRRQRKLFCSAGAPVSSAITTPEYSHISHSHAESSHPGRRPRASTAPFCASPPALCCAFVARSAHLGCSSFAAAPRGAQ